MDASHPVTLWPSARGFIDHRHDCRARLERTFVAAHEVDLCVTRRVGVWLHALLEKPMYFEGGEA